MENMNNQKGQYYFAYGKNMDFSVLRDRWNGERKIIENIINSRLYGILSHYKLVFNKKSAKKGIAYANIEQSKNDIVEGVLYFFETDDFIKSLDKYEGYPKHYRRELLSIKKNKETVDAIVYIANQEYIKNNLKPDEEYINHLLAAKDLLSINYIDMLRNHLSTLGQLKELEKILELSKIGQKEEWGGAGVIITNKSPPVYNNEHSFYPEPRYVVTKYSFELSWLFYSLRDAFYKEALIDGCSKMEFFGRLANTANRCIRKIIDISALNLCAAVLHEAFAIYKEIAEGNFNYLSIAIGNEIADDYIDDSLKTGFN